MDTIQHTHAAIIALTQYESAIYRNDLATARAHLLETMQHIIAISKLTPDTRNFRPPSDLGRPERACRYLRCMDYLMSILPIPGANILHHNHVALAWYECVALCEYHGWVLPTTLAAMLPPLAQWQSERLPQPATLARR